MDGRGDVRFSTWRDWLSLGRIRKRRKKIHEWEVFKSLERLSLISGGRDLLQGWSPSRSSTKVEILDSFPPGIPENDVYLLLENYFGIPILMCFWLKIIPEIGTPKPLKDTLRTRGDSGNTLGISLKHATGTI